jgi:hypothetical protein
VKLALDEMLAAEIAEEVRYPPIFAV